MLRKTTTTTSNKNNQQTQQLRHKFTLMVRGGEREVGRDNIVVEGRQRLLWDYMKSSM